jgi:formate dehydrogenase maturation protein FdhE
MLADRTGCPAIESAWPLVRVSCERCGTARKAMAALWMTRAMAMMPIRSVGEHGAVSVAICSTVIWSMVQFFR